MILTETVIHSHHHGATGFEIFLWVLAAISTMWLLDSGWERTTTWWRAWREGHGSTAVEDPAEDDGPCGECDGTGVCRHCRGWGVIDSVGTTPIVEQPCVMCLGTGRCWTCSRHFVPTTLTRDEAIALTERAAERSET